MFTVNSSTVTEDFKADSVDPSLWKFNIDNGNTGEITITDPLLETVESATERAKSEFLKKSYRLKVINFTTYRTDLTKNMIINVMGSPYLIKSLSTSINPVSSKTSVKGVRYE